jgi:hypothetical protein
MEKQPKIHLSYAIEKYGDAVSQLATGRARIKERVHGAYLAIHLVRPEENLPPKLRAAHAWIWEQMTGRPAEREGEGSIKAAVRRMSEGEAAEIADRILHVYREVLKFRYQR